MKADLEKLQAHVAAVDAMFADNAIRLNAMIEAQGVISTYDRSPMREMALQGLAKSIIGMEKAQAAIPSYSRTLRLYVAEVEKSSS